MVCTVTSYSSVKLSGYNTRVTLSSPYLSRKASAPLLSSSDWEKDPVTMPIRKSSAESVSISFSTFAAELSVPSPLSSKFPSDILPPCSRVQAIIFNAIIAASIPPMNLFFIICLLLLYLSYNSECLSCETCYTYPITMIIYRMKPLTT